MKKIIPVIIMTATLACISLACWLKPHTTYSQSERRPLASKPELSVSSVVSGDFMEGFEDYTADQFPMRDNFRSLKALFSRYLLGKKDDNGLYSAHGHLSKIEYPANAHMMDHAAERFEYIYNTYLKDSDSKVYLSLIPDKNYFLAKPNGYLAIDYDKFIADFRAKTDYMTYIDIVPLLELDDYYRTDSHWRQEKITDIAHLLAKSMGTDARCDYVTNTLDHPFNGVYLGQSALKTAPDTIKYLTNDILSSCIVNYYDTGAAVQGDMYSMTKAHGKDPYEMFLSGSSPLLEIINPHAESGKELVIFRDSYAASLAPLLAPAYEKITLVDIRYMQSSFVGNFLSFDSQDVLFLYSTTILNNSMSLR